jgi:hypothetical protein
MRNRERKGVTTWQTVRYVAGQERVVSVMEVASGMTESRAITARDQGNAKVAAVPARRND